MSFKKNLLKKIEIDRLAQNVTLSLKRPDNGSRVDKSSMERLLEMALYRYERLRDLDLYVKEGPDRSLRILVLDNDLALYATTVEDVVLRKSPTIREIINIRNAIKILNDSDVVVCKKSDSVAVVQQECSGALDLSMNRSDLEAIAADGRIAWEIDDSDGIRECLLLFRELLDFSPPPCHFFVGTLEVCGKLAEKENREILLCPAVIYAPADKNLKYIDETVNTPDRQRSDFFLQVATGKVKATAEGTAVFQYLKDTAVEKFFAYFADKEDLMKSRTVKELMVPLAKYATVPETATMFEAVMALETAQQEFDQTRYRHRAVLVYDADKQIVGKISQLDILKALEPKYGQIDYAKPMSQMGYSRQFLKKMVDQFSLWSKPLDDVCKKASSMKVKDFMYAPTEGEYIEESATLDQGIHQLIVGHHQSLLVTKNKEIVGILRVTDVFKEVCTIMKACEI